MFVIGYPHSIKKSAVLSIAPHSWPQLLHALVWLSRGLAEMDDYSCPDSEFNVSTWVHDVPTVHTTLLSVCEDSSLDSFTSGLVNLVNQNHYDRI